MKYSEWIEKTTPAWAGLLPPEIKWLHDRFADREIFSETDMDRIFWMYVRTYAPTYRNMARIQASNTTFDPTVTRYLEALRQDTSERTQNVTATGNAKVAATAEQMTEHLGPDVTERNTSGTIGEHTDTETRTYSDRVHEVTKSGEVVQHKTGDGAKNYTKDAAGSKDTVTHDVNTSTTTSRSGKHVTEREGSSATTGTSASKSAPMTAVNLSRRSMAGSGEAARVANGSLGAQDWSSASSYGETSGMSGTSDKTKEYYEGDKTVVQTDGNKSNNVDTTTYGREQQTGTDIEDRTSYNNYREAGKDTGSEIVTRVVGSHIDGSTGSDSVTVAPVSTSGVNETETQNKGQTDTTDGSTAESWNRYTGREGLAPHTAFGQALDYLMQYPDAILWLARKLEPCFIGVLEV